MTVFRQYALQNARVTNAAGSSSTSIDLDTASIRFDSSWAPFVQGTFAGAILPKATMDAIEPRDGDRLKFTLQQVDGATGAAKSSVFDLGLRRRVGSYAATTMTLTANSNESLLQDYADGAALDNTPNDSLALLKLALVKAGYPVSSQPSSSSVSITDDSGVWAAGQDAWEFASAMADAAGAWLHSDETGGMIYSARGWSSDTSLHTLDDSTIIDVDDTVDRDDESWATDALVRYTATTPYGIAWSASGRPARKTLVQDRDRRKPTNGNAATQLRTSAIARGRSLIIVAAIEVDARPNQAWQASFMGESWHGVAQSVQFDVPQGLMTMQLNVIES